MRFYVKDSERKPDPQPTKVNAKAAILVGVALWIIALLFLVLQSTQSASQEPWYAATCVVGILLGVWAFIRELRR